MVSATKSQRFPYLVGFDLGDFNDYFYFCRIFGHKNGLYGSPVEGRGQLLGILFLPVGVKKQTQDIRP